MRSMTTKFIDTFGRTRIIKQICGIRARRRNNRGAKVIAHR
jgi:hypothetical protein